MAQLGIMSFFPAENEQIKEKEKALETICHSSLSDLAPHGGRWHLESAWNRIVFGMVDFSGALASDV